MNLVTFEFRLYNYYILQEEKMIIGIESDLQDLDTDQILEKYRKGVEEVEVSDLREEFGMNQTMITGKSWL